MVKEHWQLQSSRKVVCTELSYFLNICTVFHSLDWPQLACLLTYSSIYPFIHSFIHPFFYVSECITLFPFFLNKWSCKEHLYNKCWCIPVIYVGLKVWWLGMCVFNSTDSEIEYKKAATLYSPMNALSEDRYPDTIPYTGYCRMFSFNLLHGKKSLQWCF